MEKNKLILLGFVFGIIFISLIFFVFGATPIINSVTLNSTNVLRNSTSQNLTGYVNASDSDGDNMTYIYNWYKNDSLNRTTLITDGLVAYYPFDNDAYDYYSNNDGALINGSYINSSGQKNSSVSFDGVDDYIHVNDSESLRIANNSFSVCFWVNIINFSGANVFGTENGPAASKGWLFYASPTNQFHFYLSNGTDYSRPAKTGLSENTWYHFCGTFNETDKGVKLFFNGGDSVISDNDNLTVDFEKNYGLDIGNAESIAGKWFNGSIDEVMIFNRTLSESEVQKIYLGTSEKKNVSSSYLSVGDVWKFGVEVADNFSISNETNSSSLTIRTANYYIDAMRGNDSWQGNLTHPWKTISKVNSYKFGSGESIYFKRGEEWNETLIINLSGTSDYPITFGAYGTGEKPTINLAKEITSWTVYNESIYVADVDFDVEQLFSDNGRILLAHHPNNGFFYVDEDSLGENMTDYNLTLTSEQVIGAELYLRTKRWAIDNFIVINLSNNVLFLNRKPAMDYSIIENYGYKLGNKLWMLDSPGEWFYDNNTNKVYVWLNDSSNPSEHIIESSFVENGIEILGSHDIIVENLKINKPNKDGVNVSDSYNLTIRNSNIYGSGRNGFDWVISDSSYLAFETQLINNTIENTAMEGIRITSYSSDQEVLIENNTLKYIFVDFPYHSNNDPHSWSRGAGFSLGVSNSTIRKNNITNAGYTCLRLRGIGNLVEKNTVENCCLKVDDGGGIFMTGSEHIVRENIVVNSFGNPEGTSAYFTQNATEAQGIYVDSYSYNILLANNTIINATSSGFNIHEVDNITLIDNVLYNNRIQLRINGEEEGVENNSVLRNIFFSLGEQFPIQLIRKNGSTENYSLFENNIYYKGSRNYLVQSGTMPNYPVDNTTKYAYYSLERWQNERNLDLNSEDIFSFYDVEDYIIYSYEDEELNNTNFDLNISGWSKWPDINETNLSWVDECGLYEGCFEIYSSENYSKIVSNNLNVEEGKSYLIKFSIIAEAQDQLLSILRDTNFAEYIEVGPFVRDYEFTFTEIETNLDTHLDFVSRTASLRYWIDNVSIKEVNISYNDPSDDSIILVNKRDNSQTFSLEQDYCDLSYNVVSNSVTLEPYRSKILLSCFCNNDGACNNRETYSSCPRDCEDTSVSPTSTNNPGGSSGTKRINISKEDLEKGSELKINKGDYIEFEFKGEKKVLEIKEVSENKVHFVIGDKNYYVSENSVEEIDLDGDGVKDIRIYVEKIINGVADIKIENVKSESEEENVIDKIKSKWYLYVVGVVIVLIVVGIVLKKRK